MKLDFEKALQSLTIEVPIGAVSEISEERFREADCFFQRRVYFFKGEALEVEFNDRGSESFLAFAAEEEDRVAFALDDTAAGHLKISSLGVLIRHDLPLRLDVLDVEFLNGVEDLVSAGAAEEGVKGVLVHEENGSQALLTDHGGELDESEFLQVESLGAAAGAAHEEDGAVVENGRVGVSGHGHVRQSAQNASQSVVDQEGSARFGTVDST